MPAGLIEYDETLFSRADVGKLREVRQGLIELVDIDFRPNWQKGAAGFRMHEAVHVQPLETMMDGHDRALAAFGPHPTENRFQPDAMFIFGPEFDRHFWLVACQRGDKVRECFLKAA